MTAPLSPQLDKVALRRELRVRRAAMVGRMSMAERAAIERGVAMRLIPFLGSATIIAGYVALGDEIDPAPLLAAIAASGRQVCLPHVVDRATPIRFLRWSPGEALVAGPFRLLQPADDAPEVEPMAILTPLVGFDARLNRLGQGAGHYDRAFAAHPHAKRIGMAWSVQQVESLPLEPWDMPLDAIVTEREMIAAGTL